MGTMKAQSAILATILFAMLWAPPSFGQLATDLGPFALNGCLTFDKNDKVYLVRRSSDFVNSVSIPSPGDNDIVISKTLTIPDGKLLPPGPSLAVAAHHGPVAKRFRTSRIQIRRTTGFESIFAANTTDQSLGLSPSKGFVLPETDALVLNSAQTLTTLDVTDRAVRNLHEHLLIGFEQSPSTTQRTSPPVYRGMPMTPRKLSLIPALPRPTPTQDELNIVDQVLLDLFLDGIADRMNTYIRSLGKTPKADLTATAYGIIKQGRQNGSLLLGEVVAFMLNEMGVPEKDVQETFTEMMPLRFQVACRSAGLLNLNGTMSDGYYAAFGQIVEELEYFVQETEVRSGKTKDVTRTVRDRLETLYTPFDPDPQPRLDRELYEKVRAASLDMVKRLEQLTAENGAVGQEELIDVVGRLLFDLDILREGTITICQERVIVDALQNLEELESEACFAVVDAFLSLDATQPRFRGQVVDPCTPVCSDARAWKHDIWFEGFGNFTSQGITANHQGYRGDVWGLNLGVERRIGRNSLFGVGFSGAFGTMRSADRTSRGENDSYLFTLYGATTRNDWTLSGAIGFSFIDYETERFVDFDRLRSSHDGNLLTGSLMLARSFKLDQSRLTPFIGFNLMNLREDEFSEIDADEELIFSAKTTTSFMQTLGVRLSGEQKLQNGWIVCPSVSAGWLHDYGSGQLATSIRPGGGPLFVVDGVSRNQNRAVLGFSLGTQFGSRLNVFASYNSELSQNYSSQTGQVGVNLAF